MEADRRSPGKELLTGFGNEMGERGQLKDDSRISSLMTRRNGGGVRESSMGLTKHI